MEFRKLIAFGKSSFVISLPKDWLEKNNLKKGSLIRVDAEGNTLFLKAKIGDDEEQLVKKIDLADLSLSVKRIIGALYKAGYDELTINFNSNEQLKKVQDVMNETCIGFEIIGHERDKIVTKNISKSVAGEFDSVLRRGFLFLKATGVDSLEAIKNNDSDALKNIITKDDNIDKFLDFCRRVVNKSPGSISFQKTAPLYCILEQIEKIGDIYADICEYALNNNLSLSKELENLFRLINEFFECFYDLFYKFNLKKLEKFIALKKKIEVIENKFYDNLNLKDAHMLFYLSHLKSLIFDLNGPLAAMYL